MPNLTLEQRFWKFVRKTDGCWFWNGAKLPAGYGRIWGDAKHRSVAAHRLSYEIHFGAIPDGLFVCHRCDNPSCVRPDHLFLGTPKDNTHDSLRKQRWAGQRKTHCKNGHPFTAENTRVRTNGNGARECRACIAARNAKMAPVYRANADPEARRAYQRQWRAKRRAQCARA